MSVFLSPNLPANVVEIGNEISQAKINEINAGTLATQTWVTSGFAPKASPTFTGTVTIPAGASISGYLTTSSASSTYQTISGMASYLTTSAASSTYQTISGMSSYLTDAPSDGSEYVRKNAAWAIATGGGGGLTISSLSNSAATTLNATAPTTGQALTFDGTELKWSTVGGGGGGVAWGGITGTLSTQTDLQTALDGKLSPKTVNTITTGPAGVQLSDARKVVYLASGGMGFQLSADNDASTPYVDGTEITIVVDNPAFGYSVVAGPGPVSINGGSSVSLTNYVSNLVKVAANTWFVS